MIWGKDDTFGRWVQGLCAIPMLIVGGLLVYSVSGYIGIVAGAGMLVLGCRCLWYAATGKNNVNRDGFE